jgi:regulator of protease activity HflC (stomatin/prohibitin superfamily)
MLSPSVAIALLCTFALLVFISVRRIPEGHAYTLRRIGGQMRTIGAGVHFVLPLIERVAHKINLLGNVVEITVPATSDSAAALCGRVYFQVMDAQRADAVIDNIADLLRRRIPELAAGPCSEEDLTARTLHLKAELNQDLRDRGLLITRVQLANAA